MKIVVPVKLVPDLVEELTIDASGKALDTAWLRLKISEFDDHAIEQAILLKEKHGAEVTVLAPDLEGVDDVLFTAAAKGADRLVKLTDQFEKEWNNHALARALMPILQEIKPDMVLIGTQAHNDLDGSLGALLAAYLGLPFVGYVAGVAVENGFVTVHKEYPGGLLAEMEVTLPAVLGIISAEQPPRYVAFSKIRQAMKAAAIEELSVGEADLQGAASVERMAQPEAGERAEMLAGSPEQIADKLVGIFKELGLM